MADMISRAAALDAIDGMKPMQGSMEQLAMKALCWAAVKTIQPVNAAPVVHARWRELKDGTEECTNCFGLCPHEENYNGDVIFNFGCEYCPWCGAKMDGERRDDDAAD